jgi:GDP-mannose 6-dehydrogenase
MKIAVFGLGYVGLTGAACLAHDGHEIVGIDPNEEKVALVNAGKSPIAEPRLEDMIKAAVGKGLLSATGNAAPHINTCAMAVICVGTPSAPDGSHNMGYIAEVTRQIAGLVDRDRREPLTVVYRSTIRPGTIDELIRPVFEQTLKDRSGAIELVYNPEFLRESVAIEDYFNPPKIVIGTKDGQHCKNLDRVNANIKAPVFYTGYREAEITKFVDNTYHAVKVAFANEIGRVCSRLGISASKVHEIFVSDTKLNISPYYFRPGGPFGGSCLPKDVRALQYLAGSVGANAHVVDALIRSNEAHKDFLFEECAKGLKPDARVLMIGLAFKSDSDDLRESPNVDLARKLLQARVRLSIYDPHIDPARLLGQNMGYAFTTLPALRTLLISKQEMETEHFDLIVDMRSWSGKFALHGERIIDVNTLP